MKRRCSVVLAMLMAVLVCWADNWMGDLDDTTYLSQVSIPGTHDSCTGEGWSGFIATLSGPSMGTTQDLTIARQLDCGVRAFDLRPCVNGSSLAINHGILQTKADFKSTVAQLCRFVTDNPTEFVIVIMRHESDGDNGNSNWAQMVSECLSDKELRERLADYKRDITVGELRGKVLILSRDSYADTPIGGFLTGWGHAADYITGTIKGINTGNYYVQDYYEVMSDKENKLRGIQKLLDYSTANNIKRGYRHLIICFNHTSGYTKSASTDGNRENAALCNQAVIDYLNKKAGPAGIVIMDFAGTDRSGSHNVNGLKLVNTIIENNKKYTPVKAANPNSITMMPYGQGASSTCHDLSGRPIGTAANLKCRHGIFILNGKKIAK